MISLRCAFSTKHLIHCTMVAHVSMEWVIRWDGLMIYTLNVFPFRIPFQYSVENSNNSYQSCRPHTIDSRVFLIDYAFTMPKDVDQRYRCSSTKWNSVVSLLYHKMKFFGIVTLPQDKIHRLLFFMWPTLIIFTVTNCKSKSERVLHRKEIKKCF